MRRRTALAALVALGVSALAMLPSNAAGAPGTHRIAGYATSPRGREVDVRLYRVEPGGSRTLVEWQPGRHNFEFKVPDGTYLLRGDAENSKPDSPFADDNSLEDEWYPDAASPEAALPITVAGADVITQDVVVDRKRVISGRVLDQAGQPVLGVYISAYADDLDPSAPGSLPSYVGDGTDADGRFSIDAGRGAFRLEIYDGNRNGYASEWFPDVHSYQDAATVEVQDDVDIGDLQVSLGATISGTVTSSSGAPVPHVEVGDWLARYGIVSGGTVTDQDGHYTLTGVDPGTHTIGYSHYGAFQNVTRAVTIGAEQQVTDEDVTLTPVPPEPPTTGADVRGRILDERGLPVPGISVTWVDDPPSPLNFPHPNNDYTNAITDADGGFHLTDLDDHVYPGVGGHFRIYFSELDDDQPYVSAGNYAPDGVYGLAPQWYPTGSSYAEAADLVVPAGVLDLGDVTLSRAGGIAGTVLHEDGSAIDDLTVEAYDGLGRVWDRSTVETNGRYRLRALPPGSYTLKFGDRLWWPAASTAAGAVALTVSAGQTTTASYRGREQLRPVTGRLLDPSGAPAAYVPVRAATTDAFPDEVASTETDEHGRFVMPTPPGTYRITMGDDLEESAYQYVELPAPVTVVASSDAVPLGTLTASPYPTVSGRITDRSGRPVVATVALENPEGGGDAGWVDSHPDGTYTATAYGDRPYVLSVYDAETGLSEFYPGVSHRSEATVITLGHETRLTGFDVRLDEGTAPVVPPPVSPTPPPAGPSPAPLASSLAVTARVRREGHRLTLRVQVIAGGVPVTGRVAVREGSKSPWVRPVRNGLAVLRLSGVQPGRHRYRISYGGSDGVLSSRTTVVVRVHAAHAS